MNVVVDMSVNVAVDMCVDVGETVIRMVAMLTETLTQWIPMMSMLSLRCPLNAIQPDVEIQDVTMPMQIKF